MSEGDPVQGPVPGGATEPKTAGEALRAARDAQGLSLDDVSMRTRVPTRHLEAIERGDWTALPSRTYAVGFGRAYARAVGLSDVAIANQVRQEVSRIGPRQPEYTPYEMADPTRVPSRGIAVVAAGIALALLILGGLWFASMRYAGGGDGGGDGAGTTPAANAVVASVPAATAPVPPPTPSGGQVTLAATDDVWLRVYDAADKTLFIGNMKAGDRFDVPADATDPKINVGRPDKLAVTLNGSAVPPLGDGSRPIKDVQVSGDAIRQRMSGQGQGQGQGQPGPGASPTAAAQPTASVNTALAVGAVAATAAAASATPRREPPRPRRQLTETQRANLESAARLRSQQRRR
jgi:cytoskeleton protein RodZ